MSIPYGIAMANLQAMFQNLDREVIHHILVKNKGNVDPSIEDLLVLANDSHQEDENLFQEAEIFTTKNSRSYLSSKNRKSRSFFENEDNYEERARELQEQKDLELALKLQESYNLEEENSLDSQVSDDFEESDQSEEEYPKYSLPSKEAKKENRATEKTIASKIADKFSQLFGRKKKAKTGSATEQKGQPLNKDSLESDESEPTLSFADPIQKEDQRKKYSFSQIQKWADSETISFDHKIEGGGLHVCSNAEKDSPVNLNLNFASETINSTNPSGRFMDDLYFNISEYSPNDAEDNNKYFKIADEEEEELISQKKHNKVQLDNKVQSEAELNKFLYGDNCSHKYDSRGKINNRKSNILKPSSLLTSLIFI